MYGRMFCQYSKNKIFELLFTKYKQNDIISNIHEIIRESSLELNNYNIGVYDTDNIYTNYEDENIKGLYYIILVHLHIQEMEFQ